MGAALALQASLLPILAFFFLRMGGVAGVIARYDKTQSGVGALALHGTLALAGCGASIWLWLEMFGSRATSRRLTLAPPARPACHSSPAFSANAPDRFS